MNEDRKRKGSVHNTRLTAMFIAGLFLLGDGTLLANNPASDTTPSISQQQQTVSINGVVIDNLGEPVIGASVVEKGTSNGTITDINGRFSLNVRQSAYLFISFVGYQTQEIRATPNMIVTLREDAELLDEVVVVGYGTQKKANLTGAVSTVDVSKTLDSRPQADVSKALQGVVPGLTILNSSGTLDAKPTITIRGTGTLSNSAKSDPLIVVDGVAMEDISYLNPQDIENISVLKDAASTSIYGTRAAFGVILITTKAAKRSDRVIVNYNNNFSWDTPTILPDYPDVPTQIRALGHANSNNGGAANELFGMYLDDMLPQAEAWKARNNGKRAKYREMVEGQDFDVVNGTNYYYADWDVVGIMFRSWKPAQSHNVNIQGTSGKTSYYLSLGYNHEEGILNFNPDKLDRYTANLNLTSEVTDWLQIGARVNFSDRKFVTPNTYRDVYTYMWRWGSFFGPYGSYQGHDMDNAIGWLKQAGDDTRHNTYMRLGGFAKAQITKGLTLNVDYTFNQLNSLRTIATLPFYAYNSWGGNFDEVVYRSSSSAIQNTSGRDRSYAFNAYANYEFSLEKDHNFNVMVGVNAEEGEYTSHWSKRMGLLDINMPEFNLATGDQTVGGSHSEWGTAGWFGRINYDYKGIWLVELNGRYDGSSKFPENDRWAFFPSGSVGYRMSEEAYFTPLKSVVNNAKLRASYGEIGNQAVGDYMYIATLNKKSSDVNWLDSSGNLAVIYDLPKLVSSTLKWERIRTLDIGGDFGFLHNDLNVSFDWYQRDTKDMLAPGQTMPQVLGADAPYVNAGSLRTRGWELSIDWRHRFKNKLTLYANASIGDFTTTITKWDNETKLLSQNYTGKKVGEIWGFETERYFTADDFNADGSYKSGVANQTLLESGNFIFGPGDIKFKDLDNSGTIDVGAGTLDDHGDLKVIGNTTPRYQYSFRLGGEWKGFDLDLFFQGIGKRQVWTQSAFVMPMMRGADALYANQTSYWTEENPDPNADFPRLFPGGAGQGNFSVLEKGQYNFYPQSKYLVNMAYLRFKNLTVGYTFPKEWTRKVYMEKARVYFSANNICELINKSRAPIDPEINTSQSKQNGTDDYGNGTWGRIDPLYRTVSFGLQVTF
ncbi:MAG: TonB-dependent receptor [Bacteroides sp.]|nr:TonB-dependent receptor [Bacteroides sp.]